jgi:hypothetical protein
VPGRLIGRERVPITSLKNSVMKGLEIELDSIPAICFKDERNAICSKKTFDNLQL